MMQRVIMFDYDDVLFPLVAPWVHKLNSIHNINVSPEAITEWDIAKFFPMLSKEEVFAPLYDDDFWFGLEPTPNGVETIREIRKMGYIPRVVTSTFYQNVKPKMIRLFECYPLMWEDVIITCRKQDVNGSMLIDDRPDNLIGGDYYSVLMDTPHSSTFDAEEYNIPRINDISEVIKIVGDVFAI